MKTQKMNVRNYWNQWSAWIRKICLGKMDKAVKQKTPRMKYYSHWKLF